MAQTPQRERIIYHHTPDEEREAHVFKGLTAGGRAQMVWDPEATLSIIKIQLLKNCKTSPAQLVEYL